MNVIEEIVGELCKILLPVEDKIYFGNPNSTLAVCTLSSMKLLKVIASLPLMEKINVAGRLLSENKGIDQLVRHIISNGKIDTIILCGKDTTGHRPGHSLLCLYRNGINKNGMIIDSESPNPISTLTEEEVLKFQKQVKIINKIGEEDISNLKLKIK
jgi:tetrahydromethanopterin S-methyltransferase subunit A